ncbi:MAG: recombinase family protein, partial [Hyphomicrobiaceae bacterium]
MPPADKSKLRAADYARFSTDLQSDTSIADQARICQERMRREGWVHVRTYQDHAMSSASRWRPDYQQMIEDARRGQFDVVVAESLDRLSRDQEDLPHLFKQLTFVGVRIFTLSEGWISELHVGLSGTMGAIFLKQLAEKTRRGLRGRVEAGRSGGGNSFGYDVVHKAGADGEPEHGLRRKNEQQAAIVIEIMTDYAAGKSPRAIAKALNARAVLGPSGGTWCPSAINGNAERGTGILNNELYVGKLVWNRLRYMKHPTTGKRQSRLNPPEEWIIKDVPDMRIVQQELWDKVKARQLATAKDTRPDKAKSGDTARPAFWEQQRPRYLLSGLMKCGCCGANYTKYGASRFGCAGARDRGTCTNKLTIRGEELEASILAGLQLRLMEPARFEQFAKTFVAETNRQRMAVTADKAGKQAALTRVERQIKRLVDAIVDGADAMPLNAKLKDLDADKSRLVVELEAAPDEKPLLHPALAIAYRDRVAALATALYDEKEGRQAFERLRSVIEEVRLTPVEGQLAIELRGDLAEILKIGAASTQGAEIAQKSALQIKVVAGA